jgi:hypothetical protein
MYPDLIILRNEIINIGRKITRKYKFLKLIPSR